MVEPDLMRDYCKEYLDNGIALFPLYRKADGNICPAVRGALINESKTDYNDGVALRTYNEFATYLMAHPKITMMGFRPEFANMIVLDLDNSPSHANKTNGIQSLLDVVGRANLSPQWSAMFRDFPRNFPCYVVTPHDGIHLYFNAKFIPSFWKPDTEATTRKNIEIKFNNQVTAAGSIRDGITYVMQGFLEDAPAITMDLLELFAKPLPKPQPARQWKRAPIQDGNRWDATPDGVIAKALEKYGNTNPNDFAWRAAVLFKNAGFDEATAIEQITATGIHQERKDKHDTITAIKGIFNKA